MQGNQPWLTTTRIKRLCSSTVPGSRQYVAGCPTSVIAKSNSITLAITQRTLLISVSVATARQTLEVPNDRGQARRAKTFARERARSRAVACTN